MEDADLFERIRDLYAEAKRQEIAGLSAKSVAFWILALDALSTAATFVELSAIEQSAALASRGR